MDNTYDPLANNVKNYGPLTSFEEIDFDNIPEIITSRFSSQDGTPIIQTVEVDGERHFFESCVKTPFRKMGAGDYYMPNSVYLKYIKLVENDQVIFENGKTPQRINFRSDHQILDIYAEGFQLGYNTYLTEHENVPTFQIFSRISNRSKCNGSFLHGDILAPSYESKDPSNEKPLYRVDRNILLNAGKACAEVFKCWRIILENPMAYIKYFEPTQGMDNLGEDLDETITTKIIFLEKLGVLNYIRANALNGISTNAIAKLLSPIISEKQVSIQPLLSAIQNNSDRNPLNEGNKTRSIEKQIASIGFVLKQSI